jgi:hypothetical protein
VITRPEHGRSLRPTICAALQQGGQRHLVRDRDFRRGEESDDGVPQRIAEGDLTSARKIERQPESIMNNAG